MTTTDVMGVNALDPSMPALVVDRVSKQFGTGPTPPVLHDVSMDVKPGEFVSIVGPSGCGKTTLLRIIQGLETPSSGAVTASGSRDVRMSYVFQRASLLPWLTVRQNVAFGLTLRRGRSIYPSKSAANARVDELLELTGLAQYAGFHPNRISGGMQQRTNLARALAVNPSILLMDEPFSALDAMTRERLQVDVSDLLTTIGTSLVLVTHDIREAAFLSDRIVVMSAHPGRIAHEVTVDAPRPRSIDFQHSVELASLERHVWGLLHGHTPTPE
jgi:ABC-type nitrate/sulfonate/bicarbonate transport system ATPase subunit